MRWEELIQQQQQKQLQKGLKEVVRNILSTNHSIKFSENEDLKEQLLRTNTDLK